MENANDKYAAIFRELEPLGLHNLQVFLKRERDGDYRPKHKSKALKLPPAALETMVLEGEDILAQVREAGDLFKVKVTFPLFDLETDLTKVQCSCLDLSHERRRHDEEMRCHHLYFVQNRVIQILECLQKVPANILAAPQSPVDELLSLCLVTEISDGDGELFETRQQILLDRQKWTAQIITQRRHRYEPAASWVQVEAPETSETPETPHAVNKGESPAAKDAAVFSLLEKTVGQSADTVLLIPDNLPLERRLCSWKIKISESAEGLYLKVVLGDQEFPVEKLIPGRGLVAWDDTSSPCICLAPLLDGESPLVERVLQLKEAIAFEDWERLARFLSHLESHHLPAFPPRFSGAPERPGNPGPQSLEPMLLLRLTPFKQGGMKIQIMVQWPTHIPFTPGQGPETIRSFSSLNAKELTRDFGLERRLASRLIGILDLEDLPEPEPWTLIAYNDALCLRLVSRLDEAKSLLPFLVEWPQFLHEAQRPYRIAAPLDQGTLSVCVGEKKDWFQMEGWLELDEGTKISLRELLATIRRQQKYVRLPDGRWAILSEHFRRRLAPLVAMTEEDLSTTPGSTPDSEHLGSGLVLNMAALAKIETSEDLAAFPFAEVSQNFWYQLQRMGRHNSAPAQLPSGLKATLRPYQLAGFQWLQQRYEWRLGACLADDMGLGKTVQTLAILLKNSVHGPALVIAPSSLSFNWAAEAQKFCPDLRITLLRDLPGRGAGKTFGAGEVVLASYGLVIRYGEHLSQTPWNIMVLDEAQHLKNGLTKTAQAVQAIKAQWTLALSGTPLENRLSDLWSLFRTVSPGLFGGWERFRRSFVFPIEKEKSQPAMERLKAKIEPFVLRRMKRDYLHELPEKTEIDLWVDLNEGERQFYEALRDEALLKIQAFDPKDQTQEPKRQIAILAALTSLRQASCHRQILDPQWTQGSTKIELLRDRLLELKAVGQSSLVFSQFTRFLRLIHQDLSDHGLKLLYLDGATPLAERQEIVARFQEGHADALLISLKAGGTGLNLTQASYVFHMDPWWNPAVENQATDRAHRMGQKQSVTVYKLRARQTIEEMIHGLHGDKQSLVNNIFAPSLSL